MEKGRKRKREEDGKERKEQWGDLGMTSPV